MTYSQLYYRKNKNKVLAYHKKRYLQIKNSEEYKRGRRNYNKKYYRKNKEKVLAKCKKYNKTYYILNKKKIDERNKAYAKKNPKKILKIQRKWNFVNHHRLLFKSLKRRAKKEKFLFKLKKEDFYLWYSHIEKICIYCNISEIDWQNCKDSLNKWMKRLQVDRKNPSKGYILSNITLACPRCNITKSDYFNFEDFKPIGELIREARQYK
jgi:hypothetical protein